MDLKSLMLAINPVYKRECPDIILAGSELDALILSQELDGIAEVAWIQNTPGPEALAMLATVRRWWVLPDAPKEIVATVPRARAMPWPPRCESIGDAFLAEFDLVGWALPQIGPTRGEDRVLWLEQIIVSRKRK